MSSQGPALPHDILANVIDILAADDDKNFADLSSISLTNQQLLHLSRKHVFGSITIDSSTEIESETKKIPLLLGLISANPQIATYVHDLTLAFGKHDNFSAQYPDLPRVLKLFTNVRSLVFGGQPADWAQLDWAEMPPSLQDPIKDIIRQNTLTSLTLHSLKNFPLLQVGLGTNINNLTLEQFEATEGEILSNGPIRITDFTIGYHTYAAASMILAAKLSDNQHVFDFNHLRVLRTKCISAEDLEITRSLLKKTTQLTAIELKAESRIDSLSACFQALKQSLNTLKTIAISRVAYGDIDPVVGLPESLMDISQLPNVLEEFKLSVNLPTDAMCRLGDEWKELDTALGASNWPHLKKVSLEITTAWAYGTDGGEEFEAAAKDLPNTMLTALSSSKTVLLDFVVKDDSLGAYA